MLVKYHVTLWEKKVPPPSSSPSPTVVLVLTPLGLLPPLPKKGLQEHNGTFDLVQNYYFVIIHVTC